MLNTINNPKKHRAMLNVLRHEKGIAQPLTLMLDLAVICKALNASERALLIKGSHQQKVAGKLAERFGDAQLSEINAEMIAAHAFSVNEAQRREIVSLILEENILDETYAVYIQQLLRADSNRFEGLGIPDALAELLVDIVCPQDKVPTNVVLCGNRSPEYTLAASAKHQVTQLPTTDKAYAQQYLKLLYLADRSTHAISENDMAIFHPETPFEAAILSEPFGVAKYKPLLSSNKYSRLSSELVQAEALMKRVDGRIACLVRTGLLSMTSGDDAAFKQALLKAGLLEAVIQLPERLLSVTAIPVAIMVINTRGGFDQVTMIDASSADFYTDASRSERTLTNTQTILALLAGEHSTFKESIAAEMLLNASANIHVNRYVKTEKQKKADQHLSQYELVHLQDIAEVRVCQMIKSIPEGDIAEDSEKIQQISQQNINRMGQIDTQTTKTIVPEESQENRINNQILQHGDILFSTKGIIGICGLVKAPAVGMIPNQSFVIIRLRNNPYYPSPKALFLYLRSALCSTLLDAQVTGAAMKVIKTQDMKMLKIPVITHDEQQALEQEYQSLLQLDEQRQALEAEINAGLNRIWPV